MSQTYLIENKNLDYLFGNVSFSNLSTMYIGLSTSVVNQDGTGATEPSGGGYLRVSVTNNKTSFSTASLGSLSNAISISFPESSASWGTITYVVIYDQSTGGNVYYFEALPTPKVVAQNTTLVFSIGAMVISNTN